VQVRVQMIVCWQAAPWIERVCVGGLGGVSCDLACGVSAQVLSADCFAAFEEAGLDNEDKVKETGLRFRDTVLAMGGGAAAPEVFKEFRGRDPTPDALLRHSGLAVAAA